MIYETHYVMSWELKPLIRGLRKEGWEPVSIERVTRHKVVLVVRDILNQPPRGK